MTHKAQPLRVVPRAGDVYEIRYKGRLYRFIVDYLSEGEVFYRRFRRGRHTWEERVLIRMKLADWRKEARKARKEAKNG